MTRSFQISVETIWWKQSSMHKKSFKPQTTQVFVWQIAQLERDIQQVLDEKQDQETERDCYKVKFENLNKELNKMLQGDASRLVDIDAMINENRCAAYSYLRIFSIVKL